MAKKESPVLLAHARPDGAGLKVWCPFCVKWHIHGWGFGHRSAHCSTESSPFKETGYFLRPNSEAVKRLNDEIVIEIEKRPERRQK